MGDPQNDWFISWKMWIPWIGIAAKIALMTSKPTLRELENHHVLMGKSTIMRLVDDMNVGKTQCHIFSTLIWES